MRTLNDAAESCRTAEAKIAQAQRMLAEDARLETVERCAAELDEAAELLRGLLTQKLDAEAAGPLRSIQSAARALGLQIAHASQLCMGWMQLRRGTGYTAQGSPVLVPHEAETLFEA
jgi:hypothetical protein